MVRTDVKILLIFRATEIIISFFVSPLLFSLRISAYGNVKLLNSIKNNKYINLTARNPKNSIATADIFPQPNSGGWQQLRQRKGESRQNLIDSLYACINESYSTTTDLTESLKDLNHEQSMIVSNNVLSAGDTYDHNTFSVDHNAFKAHHNDIFKALCTHCDSSRSSPLFYLDGELGLTSKTLLTEQTCLDTGENFNVTTSKKWLGDLYIANIFQATCDSLNALDFGLQMHVCCSRAEEALGNPDLFGTVPFIGYYLDGCGGSPETIITMFKAIFNGDNKRDFSTLSSLTIGFTLTKADANTLKRSLADREALCLRELRTLSRLKGFAGDMTHVTDEQPEFFGLKETPRKRFAGTQTAWVVINK